MIELEKFLEPIEIAGSPLENHRAYRMDDGSGKPDMRKYAGLGPCDCCDYFMFEKDGSVVLIEETRLTETVKNLQSEYHYLKDNDQTRFISKYIRQENRLKVYGSTLVLSRLAMLCKDAKDLLEGRKYKFWLVASGMNAPEDAVVFDNLKDYLSNELKGALTGNVIDDIEIIPSHAFVNKLSEHTTTP